MSVCVDEQVLDRAFDRFELEAVSRSVRAAEREIDSALSIDRLAEIRGKLSDPRRELPNAEVDRLSGLCDRKIAYLKRRAARKAAIKADFEHDTAQVGLDEKIAVLFDEFEAAAEKLMPKISAVIAGNSVGRCSSYDDECRRFVDSARDGLASMKSLRSYLIGI